MSDTNPHGPPRTDSIRELAKFWDSHDLTEFDRELEDVTEPVFEPEEADDAAEEVRIPLNQREFSALGRMAKAKGLSRIELVRAWIRQRITRSG